MGWFRQAQPACAEIREKVGNPLVDKGFRPRGTVSGRCLNELMTSTATTSIEDLESPLDVLAFARACQIEADRAQSAQFTAAVIWAEQHPPESIDEAATWLAGKGGDTGIPLAGEGAPLVAEFCVAEFALAIGRSTDSGRAMIAHAVEVKYRLPRTWARVQSGEVQAWRARRIAELTQPLSMDAAAF